MDILSVNMVIVDAMWDFGTIAAVVTIGFLGVCYGTYITTLSAWTSWYLYSTKTVSSKTSQMQRAAFMAMVCHVSLPQ